MKIEKKIFNKNNIIKKIKKQKWKFLYKYQKFIVIKF